MSSLAQNTGSGLGAFSKASDLKKRILYTLLILVIIVLVMTENLQVGFLLLVIYTVLLFRFNVKKNNEGFKST